MDPRPRAQVVRRNSSERLARFALATLLVAGAAALIPGGAPARSGRGAPRTARARADGLSVLGYWRGKASQENPTESYDVVLHISRLHSDKVDGVIQYSAGYPDPVDCTATLRRTGANANEGSWTFVETLINDAHGNCVAAIDKVKPTGPDELLLTSTYPGFGSAQATLKKQDPSTFALNAAQQDVTWTEYCGGDWCTTVAFEYLLEGHGYYDRIDEPKDSLPAWYSFTRVDADGVLFHGLENGWGLEVRPIVTRIALNEDWEGLPCLSPSSQGVNFYIRPPGPSIQVPGDYVETFTTFPGFWQSLADPQLQVEGEGLLMNPGPVNTQLTFQLGFKPATAGLPNGPCDDASPSAKPSAKGRAVRGQAAGHGARVPGLRIDGFKVSRRVIARELKVVATVVNRSKRAVRTKRAAVALLALGRLVDVEARHRKPVSQRRLAKLLDGLVSDYNANPPAAAAAGIELGPGQTPEDYFGSQANHYRVVATRGALWNSIVHGAKSPAKRKRRLAAFLRHELRDHHVQVTGIKDFSLPRALPPVL